MNFAILEVACSSLAASFKLAAEQHKSRNEMPILLGDSVPRVHSNFVTRDQYREAEHKNTSRSDAYLTMLLPFCIFITI